MSLPYIFAESFDQGGKGGFDTEADTGSLLDFPHYTELARIPGYPAPFRGAYCMRIIPGDTNDHTLLEGDLNISAGGTAWVRFGLFVSDDFAATADDIFNIFEIQETGNTVETAISLRATAATNLVEIGIGETAASTFSATVQKGVWHVVECTFTVDSGGGNDGTAQLYMDGKATGSALATLDQGAITHGVLGTKNTLATTTGGFLLFDEFAFDDTRISISHRFAEHRTIAASSFLFVGAGTIGNVKLIDTGGGDVVLELYDVDEYSVSSEPRWFGQTVTANVDVDAADVPIEFTRGCLAVLSGTLPAAQFQISRAAGWGSDGAVRTHAAKRTAGAI